MAMYTGVRVVEVKPEIVDRLYANKRLEVTFNKNYKFFQNEYVVVKDNTGGNQSAITRVIGDNLMLLKLPKDLSVSGVKPRNKEQWMAFDALLDDTIPFVTLTGRAGTGKTLLTLATALAKFEAKNTPYNKIILTKPMDHVGPIGLGYLPGEVEDKFGPYLENYMCNMDELIGDNTRRRSSKESIIEQYNMKFVPLQLVLGASWKNAFIIADEVQTLGHAEFCALATRVGENSKIVVLGDLGQRHRDIPREKTGMYKWINDPKVQESPMTASIELLKSERSPICELVAEVFGV